MELISGYTGIRVINDSSDRREYKIEKVLFQTRKIPIVLTRNAWNPRSENVLNYALLDESCTSRIKRDIGDRNVW